MTLLAYKILAALVTLIITVIAVYYPLYAQKKQGGKHHHLLDFGDAFASGVFLGAALFHMLPEAGRDFKFLFAHIHYPLAELFCAGGFLLLLFLERLALSASKNTTAVPYIFCLVIMIHSLIEGAVLGINTEIPTLSVIFLAIIAHKSSESFALSTTLTRSTLAMTPLIILIVLFSIMTPLGILLGSTTSTLLQAKEGLLLTAGFNAFAAGTFLYMSTLHHIHHHQRLHEAESLLEFVCLFVGLSVMALIALF